MKKKKDLLQTERNDLCRKEMNLQQSLSALKEELAKAEQTLRSMAGKPILNGRDSVKKVLQIFRDKGGQYAKTGITPFDYYFFSSSEILSNCDGYGLDALIGRFF